MPRGRTAGGAPEPQVEFGVLDSFPPCLRRFPGNSYGIPELPAGNCWHHRMDLHEVPSGAAALNQTQGCCSLGFCSSLLWSWSVSNCSARAGTAWFGKDIDFLPVNSKWVQRDQRRGGFKYLYMKFSLKSVEALQQE